MTSKKPYLWAICCLGLILLGISASSFAQGINPGDADFYQDRYIDAKDLLLFLNLWHQPVSTVKPTPTPTPTSAVQLSGKVYIGSGEQPLADGKIYLRREGKDLFSAVIVNGTYQFNNIPPGAYILRLEHSLFTYVDALELISTPKEYTLRVASLDPLLEAKRALSQGQIGIAESYLIKAVAASPQDLEIRAYMSVVRMMNLLEKPDPGLAKVMQSFQMKVHLYESRPFVFPEEIPADSAAFEDIVQSMVSAVIPAITASLADLAIVKQKNDFVMLPVGFERWQKKTKVFDPVTGWREEYQTIEVDLGDIYLYEALLYALKHEILILSLYNLKLALPQIEEQESPEALLKNYPSLFTLKTQIQLQLLEAKNTITAALQAYQNALRFIAKETDSQADDLFIFSQDDIENQSKKVDQFLSSLQKTTPIEATTDIDTHTTLNLYLGAYYLNPFSRTQLPPLRNQYPLLTKLTDPTFNGLLPGMTQNQISLFLPFTFAVNLSFPLALNEMAASFFGAYWSNTVWLFFDETLYKIINYSTPISSTIPSFLKGQTNRQVMGLASNSQYLLFLYQDYSVSPKKTYVSFYNPLTDVEDKSVLLSALTGNNNENLIGMAADSSSFWICKYIWNWPDIYTVIDRFDTAGNLIISKNFYLSSSPLSLFTYNNYLWLITWNKLLKISPITLEIERVYTLEEDIRTGFASPTGPVLLQVEWDEPPDGLQPIPSFSLIITEPNL